METAGKVVPQQALVRGLIAAFLADGGDLRFEVPDVTLRDSTPPGASVTYTDRDGLAHEIECDFVAGCDGDRGVSAASVPADALTVHTYDHGVWWLTVLADTPAPRHALMTTGGRGFAAQFARGPKASRFYLHCPQGTRSRTGRTTGSGRSSSSACTSRTWRPGRSPAPATTPRCTAIRAPAWRAPDGTRSTPTGWPTWCTARRGPLSGAAAPSGNGSCGLALSGCCPPTSRHATTRRCSRARAEPNWRPPALRGAADFRPAGPSSW